MSTTTISSNEGEDALPRRSRIDRVLRRRDGSLRIARPVTPAQGTARRAPLVLTDRDQRRLMAQARARGQRDGSRRVLDVLVLASEDLPPYPAELAAGRDAVRGLLEERAADDEARAREDDALARHEVTTAEERVRLAQARLAEADRNILRAGEQLNLLARRRIGGARIRATVRQRVSGQEGEASQPGPAPAAADQSADPSADPGDNAWAQLNVSPSPPVSAADATPAPPAAAAIDETGPVTGWEGVRARAAMPDRATLLLLAVILAVEIPIYWVAFKPFHGVGSTSSSTLSGTLAVSVAVLMLAAPHLAGRALRERGATGTSRWAAPSAVLLLSIWAASTVTLGVLRAKVVMAHTAVTPPTGAAAGFAGAGESATPTLVDRLHLQPLTVYWMFISLLLLSGGIGFLAGLLREHPFVDAFRSAWESRRQHLVELHAAHTRLAVARAAAESSQDRADRRQQAVDARLRAANGLYEAAALAYREGLVSAAKDDAIAEAALKRSGAGPFLPPPGTPKPPLRGGLRE